MNERGRNSKYDGLTVHLPDVSLLRRGDIMLTASAEDAALKGRKVSASIRKATGGRFSHALICTSPPTFVEAVQEGVGTISLSRCFTHDLGNVRILRYPDDTVAAKAAALAQQEIGRHYSTRRAIGAVLPGRLMKHHDDRGTFCSALVAHVFTRAGAEAFGRTSPDRTTPATIEAMPELEDITERIFRPALAPANAEEMCALDGEFAPSLSSPQTEISRRIAAVVRPLSLPIAQDHPACELEPPDTLWGAIQFVIDAIERVGRVPKERQDAYVGAVALFDRALATEISKGELETLLGQVCAYDDATLQRNVAESFTAEPDIDVQAMVALYAATRDQIPRRRSAIAALEQFCQSSVAIAAYLPLDRMSLAALERRNRIVTEILARLGVATS